MKRSTVVVSYSITYAIIVSQADWKDMNEFLRGNEQSNVLRQLREH